MTGYGASMRALVRLVGVLVFCGLVALPVWSAIADGGDEPREGRRSPAGEAPVNPAPSSSPVLVDAVYDPVPGSGQQPRHVENAGPLARLSMPHASMMPRIPGYTPRVDFDTLILIYTNTAMGSITSDDVERMRQEVSKTAAFLWRHSHLKLRLKVSYIVVDAYKDISEFTEVAPGSYWLDPGDGDGDGESVESDLLARGVVTDQYDSINYSWAHNQYGAPYAGLGGLICWSLGCTGITEQPVPGGFWDFDTETAFPHEIQHTFDAMFDVSGYPEYFEANTPWMLPGAFGESWDFWMSAMERWPVEDWFVLNEPWGTIVTAADDDDDGLPDAALDELATEASLGSSPQSRDSDGDRSEDLQEAMAGTFVGSDPMTPDSDSDGRVDGDDRYPLYATATQIVSGTRLFDGDPSGWTQFVSRIDNQNAPLSVEVKANWDHDYLYLMIATDRFAVIDVHIDADNDGWFHGRDNYEIEVRPDLPDPRDPYIVDKAHIWDSSDQIIADTGVPNWDDAPNYPYERLLSPTDIERYARPYGSGYLVQLGIPFDESTGMTLNPGEQIGLIMNFWCLDGQCGTFARLWERLAWVRTILVQAPDDTPPASEVDSLVRIGHTNSLTVTWSETDDATGIAAYDVQVREDETGVWRDWLMRTPDNSGVFTVGSASAYYFRSRAWDGAGNVEGYPPGDGDRHVETYAATGQVETADGDPVEGVQVEVIDYSSGGLSDASGAYTVTGLLAGSHELRPKKNHYTFAPVSRTITVPPNGQVQGFVGTLSLPPVVYLSDLEYFSHEQEWGSLGLDRSVDGNALRIGSVTYAKGLGTHAVSDTVYDLGVAHHYATFRTWVGHDIEAVCGDGMRFHISVGVGDPAQVSWTKVWTSIVHRYDDPPEEMPEVDVQNVRWLRLTTERLTDNICDHADWADARLLTDRSWHLLYLPVVAREH